MRVYVMLSDGVTLSEMDYVQSVEVSTGYRNYWEPTQSGFGTVQLLYPTGWATPNPDVLIGQQIEVWADFWDVTTSAVATQVLWSGVIQDFQVTYGVPYVGGVGWGDQLTLTIGAYLSEVATQTVNFDAGTKTGQYYTDTLDTDFQVTFFMEPDADYRQSGNEFLFADFVDAARYTENTLVYEAAGLAGLVSNLAPVVLPVVFSDADNDDAHQQFETVAESSQMLDFYSKVTLDPDQLAPVTVDSGEFPVSDLQLATLSPSTAQATAVANYIVGTSALKGSRFIEVSVRSEAQTEPVPSMGAFNWQSITGQWTTLTFRGSTFPVRIIGSQMSATPDSSLFRYYLTLPDNGNFLILDDAQALGDSDGFGALDYNRLGF